MANIELGSAGTGQLHGAAPAIRHVVWSEARSWVLVLNRATSRC